MISWRHHCTLVIRSTNICGKKNRLIDYHVISSIKYSLVSFGDFQVLDSAYELGKYIH